MWALGSGPADAAGAVLSDVLDQLAAELRALPEEMAASWLEGLGANERATVALALARPRLEPHQQPPPGDWSTWLFMGGRFTGKTHASCDWFDRHMTGPPCDVRVPGGHRGLIIAPTLGDAYESCVAGPAGLLARNPSLTSVTSKGGTFVRWPSGAEAKLCGAYTKEDPERLRAGGNRCVAWCEELAAWVRLQACWEQLDFALRLGHPKRVCSTTPKPRPVIREILKDRRAAVTRGRSRQNPHVAAEVIDALEEKYGGTRLGRQELEGELLEDVEGALFSSEEIAQHRRRTAPADLQLLAVGVDPPGSVAEAGIIAVGLQPELVGLQPGAARGPHLFVVRDASLRGLPEAWAKAVCETYHDLAANMVVFEKNQGWDMGPAVLRLIDPTVPVEPVTATRGKVLRAEGTQLLSQQGRLHIVGAMPELEDQMTTWVDEPGAESPDRLDGLVWAVTWLLQRARRSPSRFASARTSAAKVPRPFGV